MSVRTNVIAALAGTALAVVPSTAASAQPCPTSAIALTLSYPTGSPPTIRTVGLTCDPAGGTHPRARQACSQLWRNSGRITRYPGPTACTLEYSPVRVIASGHWRGQRINFDRTYSNSCRMRASTGSIFMF